MIILNTGSTFHVSLLLPLNNILSMISNTLLLCANITSKYIISTHSDALIFDVLVKLDVKLVFKNIVQRYSC